MAWDLSCGSNESYHALKDYVFGLRETTPNLTGYYLDDFFHFGDNPDLTRIPRPNRPRRRFPSMK